MRFYQSSGGEHGPPRRSMAARAVVMLASLILLVGGTTAKAETINLVLTGVSGPVAGEFTWTYSVLLTSNAKLDESAPTALNGNPTPNSTRQGAAVFDIIDMVAGSALFVSPFSFTTAETLLATGDPDVLNPGDSGALLNIELRYTGAGATPPAGTGAVLGILSFRATTGTGSNQDKVSSRDLNQISPGVFGSERTLSAAFLPDPAGTVPAPLPPAMLAGAWLFGMIGVSKWKKSKT